MREDKADYEKTVAGQAKDLKFQKKIVASLSTKYNTLETKYEDAEEEFNEKIGDYNDTIAELKRKLIKANKRIDTLLENQSLSPSKDDAESSISSSDKGSYSDYDATSYKYTYNYRPAYNSGNKSYFSYARTKTPTTYYSGKSSYYVKPKTYYSYFTDKSYYGYYKYYYVATFRNKRNLADTKSSMFDWLF